MGIEIGMEINIFPFRETEMRSINYFKNGNIIEMVIVI